MAATAAEKRRDDANVASPAPSDATMQRRAFAEVELFGVPNVVAGAGLVGLSLFNRCQAD